MWSFCPSSETIDQQLKGLEPRMVAWMAGVMTAPINDIFITLKLAQLLLVISLNIVSFKWSVEILVCSYGLMKAKLLPNIELLWSYLLHPINYIIGALLQLVPKQVGITDFTISKASFRLCFNYAAVKNEELGKFLNVPIATDCDQSERGINIAELPSSG